MSDKFEELVKGKKQKESDWIKTCLASMSAMLGLLIAFSNTNSNSLIINITFSVTIILFGLCILCGLLFLYNDTDTQNRLIKQYLENTNNLTQPLMYRIFVNERNIFLKLKTLFFGLLFSSIISLCTYGILLKFNV